jgi:hypothetical protein
LFFSRYVVSVARKLGCSVFLGWRDLLQVKSSRVVLLANLMALDLRSRRLEGQEQQQHEEKQQQQQQQQHR